MANVIKKINVPKDLLAELDWDTGGYLIRYRIISESKNLRSHWSPTYLIPAQDFVDVPGEFSEVQSDSDPTNTIVNVVWDDLFDRPSYDVFVAFRDSALGGTFEYDNDQFYYHGTTNVHSYSFVQQPDATSIRIIVQPAANKKLIKDSFVIYDSDNPVSEGS